MPAPDFDRIRQELLRHGVTPYFARRNVDELRDHYEDLISEATCAGVSAEEAAAEAGGRLGQDDVLVAGAVSRVELKSWIYRHPRVARVALPVAWAIVAARSSRSRHCACRDHRTLA